MPRSRGSAKFSDSAVACSSCSRSAASGRLQTAIDLFRCPNLPSPFYVLPPTGGHADEPQVVLPCDHRRHSVWGHVPIADMKRVVAQHPKGVSGLALAKVATRPPKHGNRRFESAALRHDLVRAWRSPSYALTQTSFGTTINKVGC